jgi:hypothetical protein
MLSKMWILSFLTASLVTGHLALAQESSSSSATSTTTTTTTKTRKAQLNFEDELVEGGTQKPELFYLFQKKNFNYKRLIKLRENFLPEMRKTTEDIQRVRSVN